MLTPDDLKRHLPLEGSDNTRDLGGFPVDGGSTRWKVFLRADNLATLSPASQKTLLDYGLTTVIDLREAREMERWPDVFALRPEVRYLNIPFMMGKAEIAQRVRELETREAIYLHQLETCGAAIRQIMEALAEAQGCALFHCAGGKDRTGIIAAFLLGLAGVGPEVIAREYALTAHFMEKKFAYLREEARKSGYNMKRLEIDLMCPAESMTATLRHLEEGYGGIEGYLHAQGVAGGTIASLRAKLIDTASE